MPRRSAAVLLLALAACEAGSDDRSPRLSLAERSHDPAPLAPAILRDVAMIDDAAEYTAPYVPGHRTTMDGRVALRVQGGTDDIDLLSTHLSFYLFAPEKLDAPIVTGPPGAAILADPEGFHVAFPPALDPSVTRLGHHAICDPTTDFPTPGEAPNPFPCGPDGAHDCYALTVISSTSPGFVAQLWGTPATVEVASPKTADARIVSVTLGEPVQGASIPASTEWTEPAVTRDGRLMTGRLGRTPRAWTHPETGETFVRPYDLAYALLPDDAAPCDVTGWTEFHPMSHAPFDPRMVGRYGLAAYPFRDTEGRPIPDGEDLGGTYPWVDREGANVFMTGVHGRISEQSEADYPRRCVVAGCEDYTESIDFDRGFQVAGLWTHGKFVHVDGQINNIDWAVGVTPRMHWWVDLYRDEAGAPVPIRFGSGRFVQAFRNEGPYPDGYTHNANILDSLEHLPNFRPALRPVTPRDVVWVMSSGVATDEIAFDDWLDPDALIVSNMQASITPLYDAEGASLGLPHHHNGQVRRLGGLAGALATYELVPGEVEEIHLQNAATSLRWQVPAYGRIEAGAARVEPVALGGIQGRGLWLSGDVGVVYDLPTQPEADRVPAYVGVYVDPRDPDGEARELLRFGDGTGIVLRGAEVLYVDGDRLLRAVPLPPADGWVHLGWRLDPTRRVVTLLHEGLAFDRFVSREPLFALGGGALVVGRASGPWSGFRGWIDDLVVLLHDVDPEVACNHARGTLVEVGASEGWPEVADRYPDWAHAEIAGAAGLADGRFACVTDHSADYAAHLGAIPDGARSIRADVHFPEGPLRAGEPRPDSADNPFCLTCHHAEGQGGLSLEALVYDPSLDAAHDPRRQPLQPPRRVFGNIPADWIAPGVPPAPLVAPPEGLLVDPWVLEP